MILTYMVAVWRIIDSDPRKHIPVTLADLVELGIPSRKEAGRTLKKSGLSRIMRDLIQAGLVRKEGRDFFAPTNALLDYIAIDGLLERMEDTDFVTIDSERHLIIWGHFNRRKDAEDKISRSANKLSTTIKDESLREAVLSYAEGLNKNIIESEVFSPEEKAYMLGVAETRLVSALEQSNIFPETAKSQGKVVGISGSKLKELGKFSEQKLTELELYELVEKLTKDGGTDFIENGRLRRKIRTALSLERKHHRLRIPPKRMQRLIRTLNQVCAPLDSLRMIRVVLQSVPVFYEKGRDW
jgi:hypothetical protein